MSDIPPFELSPRLTADTLAVGDWPLCRVLLMNDVQFPWVILVPRRVGMREIFELSDADQLQLLRESSALGRALMALFPIGEKLNIGALGNLVPQLHIHHLVRWTGDAAWPGPVWGRLPPLPYPADVAEATLQRLRERLTAAFPLSG